VVQGTTLEKKMALSTEELSGIATTLLKTAPVHDRHHVAMMAHFRNVTKKDSTFPIFPQQLDEYLRYACDALEIDFAEVVRFCEPLWQATDLAFELHNLPD
jgi:hypothetical protein